MQPSVLAFIGDAVFNLFIRERLIMNKKGTSHQLHILSTDYVKAASQSRISKALMETFTEEEAYIFRRKKHKICNYTQECRSSGLQICYRFEALLGYLYLTKQKERLYQLMDQAADIIESPGNGD